MAEKNANTQTQTHTQTHTHFRIYISRDNLVVIKKMLLLSIVIITMVFLPLKNEFIIFF